MADALTDLKTSVDNLTAVVGLAVPLLNQLYQTVAAGGVIKPEDIEAQITRINQLATNLQTAVTADTPATAQSAPPADDSSNPPSDTAAAPAADSPPAQ
jgi:hypothetical protein